MADQENMKELASKCATCGKALKRVKRYYRNAQYFCNKRCWKGTKDKGAAS